MQYGKNHPLEPHQIEAAILGIAKAIVSNEPEGSCDTIASCDSKGCVEKRLLAVEQIRVYLVDDLIAIAADEVRQRNNA
jgi:hypothetical protein